MLTRRAFCNSVLASLALPPAVARGAGGSSILGVFEIKFQASADFARAIDASGCRLIAAAPLSTFAAYQAISDEIGAIRSTRCVVVGVTGYTDFVLMRSLARDHALRLIEQCPPFEPASGSAAVAAAARFLKDLSRGGEPGGRRLSWILSD